MTPTLKRPRPQGLQPCTWQQCTAMFVASRSDIFRCFFFFFTNENDKKRELCSALEYDNAYSYFKDGFVKIMASGQSRSIVGATDFSESRPCWCMSNTNKSIRPRKACVSGGVAVFFEIVRSHIIFNDANPKIVGPILICSLSLTFIAWSMASFDSLPHQFWFLLFER